MTQDRYQNLGLLALVNDGKEQCAVGTSNGRAAAVGEISRREQGKIEFV